MVNDVTESGFEALFAASVTVIVQSEYVPFARVLKVMVLSPTVASVVAEEHEPPYEIVPASSVLNVYDGVRSFVVPIGVTSVRVGAVVSGGGTYSSAPMSHIELYGLVSPSISVLNGR